MAVVVVDSTVVIAATSTRDADHERGRDIVAGIDAGALPTGRLSNYVIAEVLNFVHARHRHDLAVELYGRLSRTAGFELVHATKQDYQGAIEEFRGRDALSFVDATIVAYMRREGVTYLYSFDEDFDGIDGIERLNAAENPYA